MGQLAKETYFMLWREIQEQGVLPPKGRQFSCHLPDGKAKRCGGRATPAKRAPGRVGAETTQQPTSIACVYCSSLSSIFDTGRGG